MTFIAPVFKKKILFNRAAILLFFIVYSLHFTGFPQDWFPYKNTANEWYYLNIEGDTLNKAPFDSVTPYGYSSGRYLKNGKWGIINNAGQTFGSEMFDTLYPPNQNGSYLVGTKTPEDSVRFLLGVLGYNGEMLLPMKFASIRVIIANKLYDYYHSNEILGYVANLPGKNAELSYGLYSSQGDSLLPHEYRFIGDVVQVDKKVLQVDKCVVVYKYVNGKRVYSAYNVTDRNWVFTRDYEDWNSIFFANQSFFAFSTYETKNKFIPLCSEKTISVISEKHDREYYGDYYTLSGKFLYNTKELTPELDSGMNTAYVFEGKIVAQTERLKEEYQPTIHQTTDSSFLYSFAIRYNHLNAYLSIYSEKDGMIVPPNTYHFNEVLMLTLTDNTFTLQRIDNTGDDVIDVHGNILKHRPNRFLVLKEQAEVKNKRVWMNDFGHIEFVPEKAITVFDEQGIAFEKIKGNLTKDFGENRYLIIEKRARFHIYDCKYRRFILKNEPKPLREELQLLQLSSWDDAIEIIPPNNPKRSSFFQVYSKTEGWIIYDSIGTQIIKAPYKTNARLSPIILTNSLVGILYTKKPETTEYTSYQAMNYQFLSNMRLEGIDSVHSIQKYKGFHHYIVQDTESKKYFFDTSGAKLLEFLEIEYGRYDQGSSFLTIRTKEGVNRYDKNLNPLFNVPFTSITSQIGGLTAFREGKYYLLRSFLPNGISREYQSISYKRGFTFAYVNESTFDLYHQNKLLVKDTVAFEVNTLDVLGYSIIRTKETEYWVNSKGEIYAQHALN